MTRGAITAKRIITRETLNTMRRHTCANQPEKRIYNGESTSIGRSEAEYTKTSRDEQRQSKGRHAMQNEMRAEDMHARCWRRHNARVDDGGVVGWCLGRTEMNEALPR